MDKFSRGFNSANNGLKEKRSHSPEEAIKHENHEILFRRKLMYLSSHMVATKKFPT